jgi:hypothetical protein
MCWKEMVDKWHGTIRGSMVEEKGDRRGVG